jgi:hypothetical protein
MRATSTILSAGIIASLFLTSAATAQDKTVTVRPTPKTLAAGETVYFDDKKCPAGQIAKYTKSLRSENVRRTCSPKG